MENFLDILYFNGYGRRAEQSIRLYRDRHHGVASYSWLGDLGD